MREKPWDKYAAEISNPNEKTRVWLETFNIAEEAASAYEAAACKFHSPKAKTNFPDPFDYSQNSSTGMQCNTITSSSTPPPLLDLNLIPIVISSQYIVILNP